MKEHHASFTWVDFDDPDAVEDLAQELRGEGASVPQLSAEEADDAQD